MTAGRVTGNKAKTDGGQEERKVKKAGRKKKETEIKEGVDGNMRPCQEAKEVLEWPEERSNQFEVLV